MSVGFDACGIAAAVSVPQQERCLAQWLAQGKHASMHFMEQYQDLRHDPRLLHPGARSVISVLLGYRPSAVVQGPGRIAQYAYGEDYHERVKRMLYEMIALIRRRYPDFDARPCVDTAPIMDKYWAAQAGLGWIGRNSLLVNPKLGSYCFIGELVSTAEADTYDAPMEDGCGDCHACVDACPNQALSATTRLAAVDARRCASYHTIENRDETLPDDIRLSGYAFGCDCCQLVCPHNRQAEVHYQLTPERKEALESLSQADATAFKRFTKHSALNRIKFSQWQRNLNKKR